MVTNPAVPSISAPHQPAQPRSVPGAGDWLLAFGDDATPGPTRAAEGSWTATYDSPGWRMWLASPGTEWRGMPLTRVTAPGWSSWLFGELYGTADSAAAVRAVLRGEASAAGLSGHFLLLAYDEAAGEWHVWTNRHATLHAYLATDGSRVALGSFMPVVAAAAGRHELDWEGLTTLFAFGFFGGEHTHLRGVRILRPATHYRFSGDGRLLAEARYWHWRHAPDHARSYDDTLDEFATLFGAVMGDLTNDGRVAIPISGGLDSRSTVALFGDDPGQIAPVAGRFWAFSYGYGDDSVETRIAAQVAAARGVTFTPFTIGPYLFDRLPYLTATLEGFQDVLQARQAFIGRELRDNADTVIAAHWGDVFLDDMGVDAALASGGDLVDVAEKKFRKSGSRWLLDHLSRSRVADPDRFLRDLLSSELDRAGEANDADFRFKMLKTDQWSARWTTTSVRMFQAAAFPRLPFYDARLVDFFCTVPTEFVAGRGLQLDYLRRHAPDLARIPWQVTGQNLFHDGDETAADALRRATRRGLRLWRRVVRGRPLVERNWEVQFAGAEGHAGLTHWLLRPGLALHQFVEPAAIEGLLAAFRRNPYTDKRAYTVSMLLSFSAWLEWHTGGGAR